MTVCFATRTATAVQVKVAVFNDIHNKLATFDAVLANPKPEDFDFSIANGDMINDPSAADGASVVSLLWNDYVRRLDGSQKPIIFIRCKKTFTVRKGPAEDTPLIPVVIGGGPAMNQGTVILLTADSKGLRTRMFAANGNKVLHEDRYS